MVTLPGSPQGKQLAQSRGSSNKSPVGAIDAGSVPQIRGASDPGVSTSLPRTGGEIAKFQEGGQLGAAVTALGSDLQEQFLAAEARIRTREDDVERARSELNYKDLARKEKFRLSTEEDFSNKEVAQGYAVFLESEKQQILSEHRGSPDSLAALEIQLAKAQSKFIDEAALDTAGAQQKLIDTVLEQNTRELVAQVAADPSQLAAAIEEADDNVGNFSRSLTPEQEIDHLTGMREELALTAMMSWINRGQIEEAARVYRETPGLATMLTPENIRQLDAKFNEFENLEARARAEGRAAVTRVEAIIQAKVTPSQRLRIANLQPVAGERTLEDDIAEAEAVLERPLTDAEVQGVVSKKLGLETGMQTEAGQAVADRQKIINLYGDGSQQLAAFDEASQTPDEPPKLTDVAGMRKEFTKGSAEFLTVRSGFARVAASVRDPSPAGDLALIFNFLKMVDPGSTVREGEFAQVAASGSLGEKFKIVGERLLSGKRLTNEMREDFTERAEILMQAQIRMHINLENQYRKIADAAGFDPANVVVDYLAELRPEGSELPAPTAKRPTRVEVDLQGNIVGGE